MSGHALLKGNELLAALPYFDPALLRPDRFDLQVMVDVPDVEGREQVLKIHARGQNLRQN